MLSNSAVSFIGTVGGETLIYETIAQRTDIVGGYQKKLLIHDDPQLKIPEKVSYKILFFGGIFLKSEYKRLSHYLQKWWKKL